MPLLQRGWLSCSRHLQLSRFPSGTPCLNRQLRIARGPKSSKGRPLQNISWIVYPGGLLFLGGVSWTAYENSQPFRHSVLATVRCSRVAGKLPRCVGYDMGTDLTDHRILHTGAAILGAIDYKKTFARSYGSEEEKLQAYSECHTRSARRVLRALLANGGVLQNSPVACCNR